MLTIKNLHASINEKPVLKGINLTLKPGEIHAIMGPNGAGKSSLSRVIAGHPFYQVNEGEVEYDINLKKRDLLAMEVDERAREGIFMSFQYPLEIPGVSNLEFLRTAFNAICKHQGAPEMDVFDFIKFVEKKSKLLGISQELLERDVNVDFSGGEKKKNEILQMAILSPKIAFLDETDSGLDVDSLRIVAEGINKLKTKDNAIVLITHYHRILSYLSPDFVHIFKDGKITKTGGKDLAFAVEEKGYENL